MSATAAKDEFDALFADDKRGSRHPEDEDRSSISSHRSNDNKNPGLGKDTKDASLDSEDDDDDDDDETHHTAASSSKMRTRYFLPRGSHRSDANTGPKGVIADAYAFETAKKNRRLSFLPSRHKPTTPPPQYRHREPEKSGEGTSEEDDEDEFMSRWRQSRLNELQQAAVPGAGSRRTSPSGRRWGALATVDGEGYLDAIERSPKGGVVVVLIYDDASDVSNMVESAVKQLAKAHASTRFVRLHYEEAEMERMGVPAILAYRDGDKFAGLVPVVDEIPDELELNADSLEMVMRKRQILT